jgi:hypothetical protein
MFLERVETKVTKGVERWSLEGLGRRRYIR